MIMKKRTSWFLIFLVPLLVIFLFVLTLQYRHLTSLVTLPASAEVEIKKNVNDATKSDLYLINSMNGEKIFFLTIQDVYYDHYQAAKYHNGYLYVIIRAGGPEGYKQFTDTWTDTLERIDAAGKATVIYSYRGLDYQMSADGKLFTFFEKSSDLKHSKITLTDDSGKILHTFSDKELGIEEESVSLMPLVSLEDSDWIRVWLGHEAIAVVRIDPNDFSHQIYPLSRN